MGVISVIDPNCFIWDESDFRANPTKYYYLLDELIEYIELLEEGNASFSMRPEIISELVDYFPACVIDDCFQRSDLWGRLSLIYTFLGRIADEAIDYLPSKSAITASPSIIRNHFNLKVKEEVGYLKSEIFNSDMIYILFTLEKLWGNNQLISLMGGTNREDIDVYFDLTTIKDFFDQSKRKFKPSKKHKPNGWGTVLPIHLENDCRSLIQKAVKEPDCSSEALYEYSTQYQVFIIYRITIGDLYHAYPITKNAVPKKVLDKLEQKYGPL